MGEYAEYQLAYDMRRGIPYRPRKQEGRNPVAAHCPHCGKGIRPIGGRIEESMAAHIKAKHREDAP